MIRTIVDFRLNPEGDWVAILSCGHPQHVRHNPPFVNRPWTTTEEGRSSKLGRTLNCVRCDRFEMPEGFVPYRQTPVFTETCMPPGLKKDHSTKTGVWAKIVVEEGRLRYRLDALEVDMELCANRPGIVVPEVSHRVEPLGTVRFFLKFYRSKLGRLATHSS
jgi:tellurite methyltransferase